MDFCFVYVTTPSADEARRIGKAAVEGKLAACANILPQMASIYRWEGKVEEAEEAVLILKTRKDYYAKLEEFIMGTHPNDCPCIVMLPIEKGQDAFLKWIENSLK